MVPLAVKADGETPYIWPNKTFVNLKLGPASKYHQFRLLLTY